MNSQRTFGPTEAVPAAPRSKTLHEPTQSAPRPLRAPGAGPVRPRRLSLSDDQLRELVRQQISKFGPQVAHGIEFEVRGGEVTLTGFVSCDYERRMIQQSLERLAGIQLVINEVEVSRKRPERTLEVDRRSDPDKSRWKAALIAGVLLVVAVSLLLLLQSVTAATGAGAAASCIAGLAMPGCCPPTEMCT